MYSRLWLRVANGILLVARSYVCEAQSPDRSEGFPISATHIRRAGRSFWHSVDVKAVQEFADPVSEAFDEASFAISQVRLQLREGLVNLSLPKDRSGLSRGRADGRPEGRP
jgi:hypothetical protein